MATRPNKLGKFELLARLAKGGMAEIYLARQAGAVSFSRLVVVKRILPHLAEEPAFVRMFLEEARLAAQINHTNVVQIYDVGEEKGEEYFIAMEYIKGPSVGALSRRARHQGNPLPYGVAAEIVAQACDGLHAAHELKDEEGRGIGLVHRDISPHNLMLARSGTVILVDFGIAKAQGSAVRTSTGRIKGKFPYMSPEQCRGEELDRRSDIFSLGILLHELLTAHRLFFRNNELMVLKAVTEEEITPPRHFCPQLPEALDAIVLKALERDPNKRFKTAREMGAAIRETVIGLGGRSTPLIIRDYLNEHFSEELAARDLAVQRVLNKRRLSATMPSVDQLEGDVDTANDEAPTEIDSHSHSQSEETSAERRRAQPTAPLTVEPEPDAKAKPKRKGNRWPLFALGCIALAIALGLLYRFQFADQRPDGPPLRYGFPPAYDAKVAKSELGDFVAYLEEHIGRRIEIVVPKTYRELRDGLMKGTLHLAKLPPLQFVQARRNTPELPVLASHVYEGARTYQGYLLIRSDSDFNELKALRGKRACYTDPGSTSGYLLPRYFLRKRGIDPDRFFSGARFSGSHSAAMRDVLAGKCDVAAIYSGALFSATNLGIPSRRLRILVVTGVLPEDLIAASPKMKPALREKIQRALLALDPMRDLGRPTLGKVHRISRFVTPRLEDYRAVEDAAESEGLFKPPRTP
jgi:eukaryotic-like serine/threonine-protein kinase